MATQGEKKHSMPLPLMSNELHNPRLFRYDVREVSALLLAHIETKPFRARLTPRQIPFIRVMPSAPPEHAEKEYIHSIMSEWFKIFDEAYFFGALSALVTIRVRESNPRDQMEGDKTGELGSYHSNWQDRTRSPENRGPSCIHVRLYNQVGPWEKRICEYINILPHEMIHAFLDLFSCGCDDQCIDRLMDPKIGVGYGHATAFMNPAIAMERSVGFIYGIPCNTQAANSVVSEIRANEWVPTEEQLVRYGLENDKLVRRAMKSLAADNAHNENPERSGRGKRGSSTACCVS